MGKRWIDDVFGLRRGTYWLLLF